VPRCASREQGELPEPLAEPRLDFRVDKASALDYEVQEGEFIQIIDVAGRQCSDFLAFHAHKLDAGIERGLDPQVTRTLMGTAYPTVGCTRSTSTPTWTRSARSCRTPSGATTRSRWPAPRATTRTSATRATSTARRTSTAGSTRTASPPRRAGRR
jgi:hypothetical protein